MLDDTIDVMASGHAPHTAFEKSADFGSAPWGVSSLVTSVLAIYDRFIASGKFNWDLLIRKYSSASRNLLGLDSPVIEANRRADFFVFDTKEETMIASDYFRSKCSVTPFLGRTFKGVIRETLI